MKCLSFRRSGALSGGRWIREATFDDRSLLPTSAACLVANGVREMLASLFGTTVHVRLFEPVIPSPAAWQAIVRDAILYSLRGPLADAAIVVRPNDAVAIATAAFGEAAAETRTLSPIERGVLDRTMGAIAGAFSPVCGVRGESRAPERVANINGFVTYFELQIDRPGPARLGIALSREPQSQAQNAVPLDCLLALGLELNVRIDAGSLTMANLAALELGAILPMTQKAAFDGTLYVAGRPVARGECGVRRERYAIAINESIDHERSHQSAS